MPQSILDYVKLTVNTTSIELILKSSRSVFKCDGVWEILRIFDLILVMWRYGLVKQTEFREKKLMPRSSRKKEDYLRLGN